MADKELKKQVVALAEQVSALDNKVNALKKKKNNACNWACIIFPIIVVVCIFTPAIVFSCISCKITSFDVSQESDMIQNEDTSQDENVTMNQNTTIHNVETQQDAVTRKYIAFIVCLAAIWVCAITCTMIIAMKKMNLIQAREKNNSATNTSEILRDTYREIISHKK